jgi:hypothetical protein
MFSISKMLLKSTEFDPQCKKLGHSVITSGVPGGTLLRSNLKTSLRALHRPHLSMACSESEISLAHLGNLLMLLH